MMQYNKIMLVYNKSCTKYALAVLVIVYTCMIISYCIIVQVYVFEFDK